MERQIGFWRASSLHRLKEKESSHEKENEGEKEEAEENEEEEEIERDVKRWKDSTESSCRLCPLFELVKSQQREEVKGAWNMLYYFNVQQQQQRQQQQQQQQQP
uniref:Uncharacterized protein n=1 Tax=Vespula pensylvanica TaxID=30213 RepID=A0A834UDC4_VESPE|nr:hypothetical protein H0235_005093 [Vespula pensylvanica]